MPGTARGCCGWRSWVLSLLCRCVCAAFPRARHVLNLSTWCGTGTAEPWCQQHRDAPCQDHESPAVPGTAPGASQSPAEPWSVQWHRAVLAGQCWGSVPSARCSSVPWQDCACSHGGSQHRGALCFWEWLQTSRNGHSCQDPFSSPGARGSRASAMLVLSLSSAPRTGVTL